MRPRDLDSEWVTAGILSTAHSAQHFFSSLLPPLIPILSVALTLPLWQLGLLVSLYSFVSGFGQAPLGELSDRYNRRFLLAPGLGLMGLGYVVFGTAALFGESLPTLTVAGITLRGPFQIMAGGMMITGAGSSVVHPTGYPLISANVNEDRKGRALGIWGSASKFGDTLAPAAVAILLFGLAWHQITLLLGTLGIGYAVLLAVVLGREQIDTRPPKVAESADQSNAGGTAEDDSPGRDDSDFADDESSDDENKDRDVDGDTDAKTGAAAVLADRRAFVYPMIAVLLFFVTRGVATKGVRTFVPTFVTDVYGYSVSLLGITVGPESLANVYFSALLLTAAIVQLIAGGLTDRYDHRKVIVGMFGLATLGLVALSYVQLSPLALLLALAIVGGSIWGANPARDTLVSEISPAEWEGRTFGYLWTFTQAFSAASPAIIGYIADITSIQNSFKYLALATFLAGACAALLLSPRVYAAPETAAPESG